MATQNQNVDLPLAYSGRLLDERPIGGAVVQVREDAHWRWLITDDGKMAQRFGVVPIQSVVAKANPAELFLPYMRLMCAALVYTPANQPLRLLQVGLGGGAINRFLQALSSPIHLTTIEKESAVITLYRKWFEAFNTYRPDCSSETIEHQDATNFLLHAEAESLDGILIDVLDEQGMPPFFVQNGIYDLLKKTIVQRGTVIINLPSSDRSELEKQLIEMRSFFPSIALSKAEGFQNVVLIASRDNLKINATMLEVLKQKKEINIDQFISSVVFAPVLR